MNRMLLALKRPFIWLYRFRHRCGYGVHSPFAFNLITHVIYETTPYYKYKELASEQKRLMPQKDRAWGYESLKVKRLLFRLVNYAQPATIVDAGMQAASSLYLKAAKDGADYTAAADLSELFLESGASVDFFIPARLPPSGVCGRGVPYLCRPHCANVRLCNRRYPLYFPDACRLEAYQSARKGRHHFRPLRSRYYFL